MNFDDVVKLDQAYLFQNYGKEKICFDHGVGEFLYDLDGNLYLDLVAGIAVCALGHAHPKIIEAVCDQSKRLSHVSNLYYIKEQAILAETIASVMPDGLNTSLFVNSGAEANEAALKLAFKRTGRTKALAAKNSFHGRTAGALSATGQVKYHEGFEPLLTKAFDFFDYGSEEQLKEMFSNDTAVLILESVQGEGGIIISDQQFMKLARDLCDDFGALMIMDEVQTGFGRTGKMFGFEHFGVVPDMVTLAKAMGGGFPIGAVVTSKEISKTFSPGSHGTTFGGNPLGCAVANAVISTIIKEKLVDRSKKLGEGWMKRLSSMVKGGEIVTDVRGKGLMIGIDMGAEAKQFYRYAFENKVLVNVCGGSVVRLVPPLVIEERSTGIFDRVFQKFLEKE
ncbi:MAG TPA: acetylornithine/succinylornithine family transaminase [Methanomassiliicoccales archaeon]|nr:acetylornithine/succinylornithine family transaminase [Methanomassiliicoccales archaeon]